MMIRKGENRLDTFNDELLSEAFRIFDKDGNGLISEMEIRTVMSSLGKNEFDLKLIILFLLKIKDSVIRCCYVSTFISNGIRKFLAKINS